VFVSYEFVYIPVRLDIGESAMVGPEPPEEEELMPDYEIAETARAKYVFFRLTRCHKLFLFMLSYKFLSSS